MNDVDRLLLDQVGGPGARVVVLPTAAGLEEAASPRRWADSGIRHFERLGAQAEAAEILNRKDALDARWLPRLQQADLIYFSGGNPRHLVETLTDTPAWQAIHARHTAGAVLAGCSAGAMAFGGLSLQPRRLWTVDGASRAETWYPALGLVPGVVVLPHFDRWMARMGDPTLKQLAASLPQGVALIGVDEDTALVRLDSCRASEWQVMGRKGVSVIDAEIGQTRYRAGDAVVLA
jgi:cyanophycinase